MAAMAPCVLLVEFSQDCNSSPKNPKVGIRNPQVIFWGDDERPFYRLAVQQAEAAYNIRPRATSSFGMWWQESQGLFGVLRCKIHYPTCVHCFNMHGIHDVFRAIYSISCFAYSDMISKAPFSKIPFSLYPKSHYHYSRHSLTQACRQGRTSHVLSLGAGSRFSVKLTWVHKVSQKHGEGLQGSSSTKK